MKGELKIKLPDWTFNLPNHTTFKVSDVASFLGVSSQKVNSYVHQGEFIPSAPLSIKFNKQICQKKLNGRHWDLGSLREYEKQQSSGE
jgi:hypothetical protein